MNIVTWHTNAAILHNAHKPPVGVAIVKENHSIALGCVCLALNGSDEVMKGIDEFEIDVL